MTATETNSDNGPILAVADDCSASTCDTHASDSGVVSISNTSSTKKRFYVAAQNLNVKPYEIQVDTEKMASHADCASAKRLSPGGPSTSVNFSKGFAGTESCNGFDVRKLFYKVTLPPNHRLFTYGSVVTNSGMGVDLRESCGASSCLDAGYVNRSNSNREIILEAHNEDDTDAARLRAETVEVADHAQCSSPKKVSIGETIKGEAIRSGGELYNACNLVATRRAYYTLFYRVDVPLGRGGVRVRAKARDSSETSISLQAVSASAPGGCQPQQNQTQCITAHRAYRKRTSEATITLDGTSGGGRNPAPVLVAVTMAPESGSGVKGIFDLTVEKMK